MTDEQLDAILRLVLYIGTVAVGAFGLIVALLG